MPERDDLKRMAQLNPQATDAVIGIRSLRTIKVYPLSMADQLELTDILTAGIQEFVEAGNIEDIAFVGAVVQLIKENLGRVLTMATDEDGNALLKELTNEQAITIAEVIYDMNYGDLGKNVKSLAGKLQKLFRSARQSRPSFNTTVDTDSKTSSESPTEKEELQ